MTSTRFLDLHAIHPVPFALLNRDDLGAHKTMTYATPRLRVSSQCWKRAIRERIEEDLAARGGDPAVRTKRLAIGIADLLAERGMARELADLAGADVVAALGKAIDKDRRTGELIYLTRSQMSELADLAAARIGDYQAIVDGTRKATRGGKKATDTVVDAAAAAKALGQARGTVALMGRMLTGVDGGTVDGAVSVAHAFTVHTARAEDDYFTAVDDLNRVDDPGAGQMGNTEHGAGVYYRYASVDVRELQSNLNDDSVARLLLELFLTAFVETVPGAKRRSTGTYTLPDLVCIQARTQAPRNFAGAFEAPVRATSDGHSTPARQRLDDYAARQARVFGDGGLQNGWVMDIDERTYPALGQPSKLPAAVAAALTAVGL